MKLVTYRNCKWAAVLGGIALTAISGWAQTDPGPRGGTAGAGGTFPVLDNKNPTLDAADKAFFAAALLRFQEVDSV
jgi:hypothetical protein